MSHTHQAKRPYAGSQPSITSYFLQSPGTTSPATTYSIAHPPPLSADRSPALPPNIQANLLSVGMRVRKSVPEGYKTGSYSAFTLFSDPAPARLAPAQEQKIRRAGPRPRANELAPFCGIMKVGGMAQQPAWDVYDPGNDSAIEEDDDEGVPALSQGSTNSDMSVVSRGSSKRRFGLDAEDEAWGQRDTVAISGRRIIPVPRRKGMARLSGAMQIVGQENLDADVDFGEADFLDYGLVDEIQMGGV